MNQRVRDALSDTAAARYNLAHGITLRPERRATRHRREWRRRVSARKHATRARERYLSAERDRAWTEHAARRREGLLAVGIIP
jgi:hypothetical protein